jgi:hypothetical protein
MLAEKELQGQQPTRLKSSFTPHHTSITPSTSRAPATTHFLMTPLTSHVPSTLMTPPPAHRASETIPPAPHAAAKSSSSSTTSISRTSDIKCHRCHGVGHFQSDCPSKKSYIATDDGGYVSTSDVEDDFHFKLTMQVTLMMTMPRYLGVSIQRSKTPKPMWCSGF